MIKSLQRLRVDKYRKFPRAYDLGNVGRYLEVLHDCPIPLREIEGRKLQLSLAHGKIARETGSQILQWKRKKGLENADESEYRYLLRDLAIVDERNLSDEFEKDLPIGGDGPPIGALVSHSSKGRLYYLNDLGEKLYQYYSSDRPAYQSMLFWLILRNQSYLPLIQQVILDRESYHGRDLREVMQTSDSTSVNCALQWLRYFGIAKCSRPSQRDGDSKAHRSSCKLGVGTLGSYLLAATILEINQFYRKGVDYYIKEIEEQLNETFSLNPSSIDFVAAVETIFRYCQPVVEGYASSRGDITFPNFPKISIVRFEDKIPLSILMRVSRINLLRLTKYARTNT